MPNKANKKHHHHYKTVPIAPLHPKINADDLIDDRVLSADQILLIEEKLQDERSNCRFSKRYLEEKGISIGRGGILKIEDQVYDEKERVYKGNQQYSYYATYKISSKSLLLGEGGYGKVKLIQNLKTKEFFVLKIQSVVTQGINTEDEIANECKILEKLQRGFSFVMKKNGAKSDVEKRYSIQKLIPGISLKNALSQFHFPPIYLLNIALQILRAIQQMHDLNILHRDIKEENLMYDFLHHLIFAIDFGSSAVMHNQEVKFDRVHGTIGYLANEIFDQKTPYSTKVEAYALGGVLQQLFGFKTRRDIFTFGEKQTSFSPAGHLLGQELRKLANDLSHADPNQRVDIPHAITQLQDLYDKHFELPEYKVNVGMIHISDFTSYAVQHPFQYFMDALTEYVKRNKIDQLVLMDSSAEEKMLGERAFLRDEIIKSGILLHGDILLSQSMQQTQDFLLDFEKKRQIKTNCQQLKFDPDNVAFDPIPITLSKQTTSYVKHSLLSPSANDDLFDDKKPERRPSLKRSASEPGG